MSETAFKHKSGAPKKINFFVIVSSSSRYQKLKANEKVTLPGDGFFEFSPPPGKEQLFVVATEKPVADRDVLASVLTKKPGEELTAEEIELKRTLKATRKAMLISV